MINSIKQFDYSFAITEPLTESDLVVKQFVERVKKYINLARDIDELVFIYLILFCFIL